MTKSRHIYHVFTYEDLSVIKRAITEGKTTVEVAKLIGCSPVSVRNQVKRYFPDKLIRMRAVGQKARGKSQIKLSEENLREIRQLSVEGFGIDWIGKKMGVDPLSIRYRLKRMLSPKLYVERHGVSRYRGGPKGRRMVRGHLVQSYLEEIVVHYLLDNSLKFKTNVSRVIQGKIYYPDFYLFDFGLHIEVCGMSDLRFYQKRMDVKRRKYRQAGFNFMFLYKEEFAGQKVPERLIQCLSN